MSQGVIQSARESLSQPETHTQPQHCSLNQGVTESARKSSSQPGTQSESRSHSVSQEGVMTVQHGVTLYTRETANQWRPVRHHQSAKKSLRKGLSPLSDSVKQSNQMLWETGAVDWFYCSAPLVSHGSWSDLMTKSKSGLGLSQLVCQRHSQLVRVFS